MAGAGTGYFGDLASIFGGTGTPDQFGGAASGTLGLAGMALTAFGIDKSTSAAKEEAGISMQEAQTEMQMNTVRQTMMMVDSKRKQIQAQRNADLARAQGKSAAVNQGGSVMTGQAGSGYAGGQAQETATEAYNVGNIGQDVFLGNQMFSLTNQLDQEKIKMAQAQSDAATGSGMSSLGGALVSGAGMFAKLAMGGL